MSCPNDRTMIAVAVWNTAGTMNDMRHAMWEDTWQLLVSSEKMRGMMNWVNPEPTLAQPAETPLARPTTEGENMELIQNWFATKFASENPIRNRTRTKDHGVVVKAVARTKGMVRMDREAEATRGPTASQMGPITKRERMAPMKEAIPERPMSSGERPRSRLMMGRRGGIEKVEKKLEKRESQARWKASMWGDEAVNGRKAMALPSESTGIRGGK